MMKGLRFRTSVYLLLCAFLTALTTVLTILVKIPVPATQGYINLGDVDVFFAGLLLGPVGGGIAGGVGSALADAILGYYQYAPVTLVVQRFGGCRYRPLVP